MGMHEYNSEKSGLLMEWKKWIDSYDSMDPCQIIKHSTV